MNDVKAQAEFTEFVLREMPSGTVISDPAWWAPRLWRTAVHAMTRGAAPVKESLTTDERARFEVEMIGKLYPWLGEIEGAMAFRRGDKSPDEYFFADDRAAWLAWQARAKIAEELSKNSGEFAQPVTAADAAQAVAVGGAADDPHEFGCGIVQSPGARYWQRRSAKWMARAVALGWREHRDACQEAGTDPDATPPPPADDARDGGRILLRQAIDAMSKLRQSLEFPGEHGGLYVFPEHAVRKFTDEQARIMYEEKRLAGGTKGSFTDSDRLEFVMRKFPGSAARDAGITWGENTIDAYRAAIDRAMGAKDCE